MSIAKKGCTVTVNYTGTLQDGAVFDDSKRREAPWTFTVGGSGVIPGFSDGVENMTVGETKTFNLSPEQAYGHPMDEAIHQLPKERFPPDFEWHIGRTLQMEGQNGSPIFAKVVSEEEETVTLDLNHPLAGQTLTFEVELLEVTQPIESE